jgi:hypothetical protein
VVHRRRFCERDVFGPRQCGRRANRSVTITADLTGLTVGRAGAPVRGSGIFVSGAGETGGRLIVSRLETGAVYSDGGIAPGTPDRITGGVFVVSGAFVDRVLNPSPVTTYGPNDMVLDNWGRGWTALLPLAAGFEPGLRVRSTGLTPQMPRQVG